MQQARRAPHQEEGFLLRLTVTALLALCALAAWTDEAVSQACPVPTPSAMTAPAPAPNTSALVAPAPANCTVALPINGVCGTTSGTCAAGTATAVNSSGAWSCVGSNGGTTATCSPPPPPATTITIGETSCALPGTDGGNAGLLLRQAATLTQAGTLQSLSFCVTNPGGQLRLGVYDSSGNIIVQTAAFTPVAGLNTVSVGHVPITAGNYFLAHEPNNSTYPVDQASGSCQWTGQAFGAMPAVFPPIPAGNSNPCHWGMSATLSVP